MFEKKLDALRRNGLLREITDRAGRQGPSIFVNGENLLNFSSNDYLGLAANGKLIEAAAAAARRYGAGAGAARLLSGGTLLHHELERQAASFTGYEAAVLFNSGYHANTGAIPALAGPECTIFSDELNHASIIDGCRLSKAKTVIFRHADTGHLEELLLAERPKSERAFIITESVFSMDGDIAPLDGIFNLAARHGADLYVDDAHAVGVLGGGRGSLAHFGLAAGNDKKNNSGPSIVQMCTFSKALGSYGAFVAAGREVIEWLKNTARTFIFSTALPPSAAGASLAAMGILGSAEGSSLVGKLHANRQALQEGLAKAGFEGFFPQERDCSPDSVRSPIVPVLLNGVEEAMLASRRLFDAGFYVPAIRPPTVKSPRLRLQVTAAHSKSDMDSLIATLQSMQPLSSKKRVPVKGGGGNAK